MLAVFLIAKLWEKMDAPENVKQTHFKRALLNVRASF